MRSVFTARCPDIERRPAARQCCPNENDGDTGRRGSRLPEDAASAPVQPVQAGAERCLAARHDPRITGAGTAGVSGCPVCSGLVSGVDPPRLDQLDGRLEAENFASAPFQPRPGFAVARPHQCGPALGQTVGKARVIGGRSAARIRAGLPSGLPGLLPQHNEPPAPARHIRGFWGTLTPPSIPDKVLCGKTLMELGEGENWSML